MIERRPFDPQHLREFAAGAAEEWLRPYLEKFEPGQALAPGPSWSLFWDGRLICCGGFVEVFPGSSMRATAWTILMTGIPVQASLPMMRQYRAALAESPYRRIEAHVDCRFEQGHRLARLLGFSVETDCKPLWTPEGHAVSEYVILRPDR